MPAPRFIASLLEDPPARFVFELSEAGIAAACMGRPPQIGFQALEPDVIAISPLHDNVLRMEALTARVRALVPRGDKKHQRAALILPDFSVRVTVLDFDGFPSDADEQLSLVRFRIKKSLPFDLESAGLSYYPQPGSGNGRQRDVVVAVAPMEILARYEAPFRAAGLQPGMVTTSSLCALELVKGDGVSVLVKLSGRTLVLAVISRGALKLLRTIELDGGGAPEIASHLYPTFAYIEDQLAAKPQCVFVCGFGPSLEPLRAELEEYEGVAIEPLRSRFGTPGQHNGGLLGYLETLEDFRR